MHKFGNVGALAVVKRTQQLAKPVLKFHCALTARVLPKAVGTPVFTVEKCVADVSMNCVVEPELIGSRNICSCVPSAVPSNVPTHDVTAAGAFGSLAVAVKVSVLPGRTVLLPIAVRTGGALPVARLTVAE